MRPVLKGREGLSLGEICWRPSGWREPELGRKPRFSCLLLLLSFLPSFLPSTHVSCSVPGAAQQRSQSPP